MIKVSCSECISCLQSGKESLGHKSNPRIRTVFAAVAVVLYFSVLLPSLAQENPLQRLLGTIPGSATEQVRLVRSFAAQGRPDAEFLLGTFYANGNGVPMDYAAAKEWYRKASKQGDRNATFSLGLMEATSLGGPQDSLEAAKWYQEAAQQGHPGAQMAIGLQYATGVGAPRNDAIAARWIYRAAVQGLFEAQVVLADMFASGTGVPKNNVAGYAWSLIAEADATDQKIRDRIIAFRQTIGSTLNPEQHSEAQKMTVNWKPILETPMQPSAEVSREQDGIWASLAVQGGQATVSWHFVHPLPAPLTEVNGTVNGSPLGIPQLVPYLQQGTNTWVMFLLDVSDPRREAQIQQDKLTLGEIVRHAQVHRQIDVAVFAEQLNLLVPAEADNRTILDLANAAQLRAGVANLGKALLAAIDVPSSAPAKRRAIFVFTDGHADDKLDPGGLIENAKRNNTTLNFIVTPSERTVNLVALEALAQATGGSVVKPSQLAAFLKSPFELIDSGAAAHFPIAHLRRQSQTDPSVDILLKYGDRVLELTSTAVNEARLERQALGQVITSCDSSCTKDFLIQVQDRINVIGNEEKTYQAAEDAPALLREYIAKCVVCNFRNEAETRANALEEITSSRSVINDDAGP